MYGYLGQPAAGADVTPLLVDGAGNTFLAVFRPGDGREVMVMTEGSFYPAIPPAYLHAQVLPYGMINWATRGVFLGERHVYFVPQPDDVLGWGDRWDAVNHSYIFDTGYRNSPADLDNLVAWQNAFRADTPQRERASASRCRSTARAAWRIGRAGLLAVRCCRAR